MVPLTASATAIAAAFDPNGEVTDACTSLTSAFATATNLETSISNAGGNIRTNSDQWAPMMTALEDAKLQTCTTLVDDLKDTANSAVTAWWHGQTHRLGSGRASHLQLKAPSRLRAHGGPPLGSSAELWPLGPRSAAAEPPGGAAPKRRLRCV